MCQFQCLNNWRSSEFKETPKLQTGKQKHASKQHFLLCRRPKSSSWQQHREAMIPSAATRWQAWNGCNLLREWLRGVYFRGDCHFLSTTLCTACQSIVHGPGYAGTEVNTMPEICKKSLEDIFFFFLYVGSCFQKMQVECLVIRRWAACGEMFFTSLFFY